MQHVQLYFTDVTILKYKKVEYNNLAVKVFQYHILEPYRSYLMNFELITLE